MRNNRAAQQNKLRRSENDHTRAVRGRAAPPTITSAAILRKSASCVTPARCLMSEPSKLIEKLQRQRVQNWISCWSTRSARTEEPSSGPCSLQRSAGAHATARQA
jgi:hypothetical protein